MAAPPSKPKGKPVVAFRAPPPLTTAAPKAPAGSVDAFVASGQPVSLTTVATAAPASSAPTSVRSLALSLIRRDPRAQPRERMSDATVDEYRAELARGVVFPPVVVFFDGEVHWLADGFHRLAAADRAQLPEFLVDVRPGTLREAILHSVGANALHGLRRTNEDKRRAVFTLLRDREWSGRSDRWIGQKAGVHHDTVGRLRTELAALAESASRPAKGAARDRLADSASGQGGGSGRGALAESASRPPPAPAARQGRDGRTLKNSKTRKPKAPPLAPPAVAPGAGGEPPADFPATDQATLERALQALTRVAGQLGPADRRWLAWTLRPVMREAGRRVSPGGSSAAAPPGRKG